MFGGSSGRVGAAGKLANGRKWRPISLVRLLALVALAGACLALFEATTGIHCYATGNLFGLAKSVGNKEGALEEESARSFHQFMQLKPESTVIGELKPNASDAEVEELRTKIAATIMGMQLMDKSGSGRADIIAIPTGADCSIGPRIPGKCHKIPNGVSLCQTADYVAISSDCK